MLKGAHAKLAKRPSEGEVRLVTTSLGFVKRNKESAGQWKVLDLPGETFFVFLFFLKQGLVAT